MAGPWEAFGGGPAASAPQASTAGPEGPWAAFQAAPAATPAAEPPKEKFGLKDTWPAKLAKSIYEAVTLPGEGYQGKLAVQPEKPGWTTEGDIANQDAVDREVVRRSVDLAGIATPATVARAASVAAPVAKAATEGQRVAQAADRLSVDLPRAVTSDTTAVQQMGKIVTSVPVGGTPLRKASQQAVEQIGQKADDLQASLGSGEAAAAGQAAREGLENYIGRETQKTADALYSKVDDLVNPVVTTPLKSTLNKANTIEGRRTLAAMSESPAVAQIAEAITRPEGLTYEGIKQLRTSIGELLKGGPLPGNISQSELKQIYSGLSDDLKAAVQNAGGDRASSLFNRANRYYDLVSDRRENLARILNAKSDEGVFSKLLSAAGSTSAADTKLLAQARKAVAPEDWNEIGSAVIARLGRDAEGNFTPDRFTTAWGKLSEQGKSLLFSPEHRATLNDIATISSRFKRLNQFANPSGTGQTVAGVAGLGGAFVDPVSLIGGVVSARVLSGLLAKPATTKAVSRWAKVYEAAVKNPGRATAALLKRETQSFSASIANALGAPQLTRDLSRAIQGAVPAGAGEKDEKA